MSQSLLNKIWSFLTLLLLYLCLNVWSITQQWQLSFPGNPFKVENVTPNGGTVYGVPICGMLLILVCAVTRIYASRSTGPRWENRLPRFGDFPLDTTKRDAKAFQVVMLCVMLLLPAVGAVHFQTTFVNGTVREVPNDCAVSRAPSCGHAFSGWKEMFLKPRQVTAGAALKYDPNKEKNIGPDFIQLWEPWAYLVITVTALGFVLWALTAVFRGELHRLRQWTRRTS
jgi:hypothetical protein